MNSKELREVFAQHNLWLTSLCNGSGLKADLRQANLRGANLRQANLRQANLHQADLYNADLLSANLRQADLRDASLFGANLRGANLRQADLRGADLRGADLRDADLRGADLRHVDLRSADLRGVNLFNCVGDGVFIRTLQTEFCIVNFTKDMLHIGCESHTYYDWFNFDFDEITCMDAMNAQEFWIKYKDVIFNLAKVYGFYNPELKNTVE